MRANSRVPTSAQAGIHEQLGRLLDRHAASEFRKPCAPYNVAAFAASMERREKRAPAAPLIVDAGCGVGESSIELARAFPDHYVIGIDQSADRLARQIAGKRELPANVDLVRADLVDYWRLLHAAGVRPARQYLLYPNPWPKIGQLARRWHGHPVFPTLLALGGVIECRSNWRVYVEEFCFAVERLRGVAVVCETFLPQRPMTPFERKYLNSGQALFRACVELAATPASVR